jgi:hypothetical protein
MSSYCLFLTNVGKFYSEHKYLPDNMEINDCNENEMVELITINSDLFGDIKLNKLTPKICRQAVITKYSLINDIPEKFCTPALYSEILYYKGIKKQTLAIIPTNLDLDELVSIAISKHHNLKRISGEYLNNNVINNLINNNANSTFLTGLDKLDIIFSGDNLLKLYNKYGKAFLNNINVPLTMTQFKKIITTIPNISLNDFTEASLTEDIIKIIITYNHNDILNLSKALVTPKLWEYIYSLKNPIYYDRLKGLNDQQITEKIAQIMKNDGNFKITDIPSAYVTTAEYLKNLNNNDDLSNIASDAYNQELANKVYTINMVNLPYIPSQYYTQEMLKTYSLFYPDSKFIGLIEWDQDYVHQFVKIVESKYFRFIPTAFRDVEYYQILANRSLNTQFGVLDNKENYQTYKQLERENNMQNIITRRNDLKVARYNNILIDIKSKLVNNSYLKFPTEFKKSARKLNNYNTTLMQELIDFANKTYLQTNDDFLKTCGLLLNTIRNGIKTSTGLRDFDALDFAFYTDLNIFDIINELKRQNVVTPSDLQRLYGIAKYFGEPTLKDEEMIMNVNLVDENGHNLISDEDRLRILTFMKNNGIPITVKAYLLIKDAYLNNNVNLECIYPKKINNNVQNEITEIKQKFLDQVDTELHLYQDFGSVSKRLTESC